MYDIKSHFYSPKVTITHQKSLLLTESHFDNKKEKYYWYYTTKKVCKMGEKV